MKTVTNAVQAAAEKKRAIAALERMWPELLVFAGPFDIQSPDPELQAAEKAACAKLKAEFQNGGVPVRVVLNKHGAWVLRARAGIATWGPKAVQKFRTEFKMPHAVGKRGKGHAV